jgi:hypothetical protein
MSEFQVVLTGVAPNAQRHEVIAKFAERFQMAVEKAEQVFARCPTVIKKNLDRAAADRYAQVLAQLGVVVEVQAMKAELSPVPIEKPQAEAPTPRTSVETAPVVAAKNTEGQSPSGYAYRIEGAPDYAFVTVTIPAGETLKVEASAMATMDTNLVMKTKFRGGLGRRAARRRSVSHQGRPAICVTFISTTKPSIYRTRPTLPPLKVSILRLNGRGSHAGSFRARAFS